MAKQCRQWDCPITEIEKIIEEQGCMCNADCEDCESCYDNLDDKTVDARELVSMINGQLINNKDKHIQEFAEKIIDLIYGHADGKPRLKFESKAWEHHCPDGCCYEYGTELTMNGEEILSHQGNDVERVLKEVLTKLGYEVEFETICED